MIQRIRPTQAYIDLNALEHNWNQILKVMGSDAMICPMVKANAYGHGSEWITSQLIKLGAQQVGVSLVEEGLQLLQSGIDIEVLVFGYIQPEKLFIAFDRGLTPVLNHMSQLDFLRKSSFRKTHSVHIKFNTGMNRLGFEPQDAEQVLSFFEENPHFHLKGIHSHLHSAETADDPVGSSFQQAKMLQQIAHSFKHLTTNVYLLNSAGIASKEKVSSDSNHYLNQIDWGARPGIMLYGYHSDSNYAGISLKPVMSLESEIVSIRKIPMGQSVSYGATWVAERNSLIAVVQLGYADGIHRLLSNHSEVVIHEEKFPLIGTVCMDHFMVDITRSKKQISQGDKVLIFGKKGDYYYGADQIARFAKTISYEILTSVSQRVPRTLEGENK